MICNFFQFMCDRLSPMRDHIIDYLENSNEYAEEFTMRKKWAEELRNEIQKLYKIMQT